MAGIGFQLRKVIGKGDLSQTLGAALSGIFIVAGPWLMSIVSISLIRFAFSRTDFAYSLVFQSSIIYAYALSISLFAGLHQHFSRLVSDLIWENRQREAATWLIRFSVFAALLSGFIASVAMAVLRFDLPAGAIPYQFSVVLLFVVLNVMWLVMLFVSMLRRYWAILGIFALGMALSVVLVTWWSTLWGVGGAVLGFAIGHAVIVIGLFMLSLARFPPSKPTGGIELVLLYGRKYLALVLTGFFYYSGQWIDKIFFWVTRGTAVQGTPFRLFDTYDVPVYLAGLSIIPGLVYFVVYSETEIFSSIQHFLFSLTHGTWVKISAAKRKLASDIRTELRDQSIFQLFFSGLAAFILTRFSKDSIGSYILLITIAGAFFQFTLMTLLNFLYYFELYRKAMAAALLFLVLNGLVFPAVYLMYPGLLPGTGFLVSAAFACVLAWRFLTSSIAFVDRTIYLKSLM
jgi:uncharacterized membrane protein